MNATRVSLALLVLHLAAASASAVVTQATYQINPGGVYQYFPSGFVGIPGGMPNEYQLDFGIGGTFVYELDTAGPTARLLNLNLVLTGNESIQAAPPLLVPVTADRVEAYLASHTFVDDFIGGFLHLKSSTHPNLKLTDTLSGGVFIFGGYDLRPVDGDGLHFQFTSSEIPEPSTIVLTAAALVLLGLSRRGQDVRLVRSCKCAR